MTDREARLAAKRERRAQLEAELGARLHALPVRRYGVILADPAWRFEPHSRVTGQDRAADNHYATASLTTIKSYDVASIAAKDCALFLWATWPLLPQALEVMACWGFTFKTGLPWVKPCQASGYWFFGRTELLLLGTRGKIPCPSPGLQWQGLIEPPAREHSRKPDQTYELNKSFFPTLPKIELFARHARAGWDRHGAEAPPEDGEEIIRRLGL